MLYYYFGSKEQLFTAVLEHAFFALTEAERELDLDGVAPVEAVTRLAHFVWDYYRDHPELLRLINNENLHEARYLHKSTRIREMMSPIVAKLGNVLTRGQKAGLFRTDVDPLRFYVTLSGPATTSCRTASRSPRRSAATSPTPTSARRWSG